MNASPPPLAGKRAYADVIALVVLFVLMVIATWRRWPDPLVDVWRNLYIPWRVSEGALWGVEVADWYGPLPALVLSAAFTIFGPGLDVLIVINMLVAIGCVVTLHAALLEVGDRFTAAVGAAVFVLIFTVGNYTSAGNYNFITPYVAQATWGFLGVLLALLGTQRGRDGALLAGVGLGLGFVNKAELAFAAFIIIAAGAVFARRVPWKAAVGFVTVVAPLWLLLALEGGPGYATWAAGRAVFFVLDPRIRDIVGTAPILAVDLGTDAPWANLVAHLEQGALGGLVLALFAVGARVTGRARQVWAALTFALVVALVWSLEWVRVGRALALPVVVAALVWSWRALRGDSSARGSALLAIAAVAMLSRMALNVRLFHYGFTMAVLVTMVLVHLLVFALPRQAVVVRALAALLVLGAAGRLGWSTVVSDRMKTLAVGTGRDATLAWSPEYVRRGTQVNEMLDAVARAVPPDATLVVFPDGAAVSYLSRRPSSVAEFEFNPVSLAFAGGPALVRSHLEEAPPDAILLCAYQLGEHGVRFFGDRAESGSMLLDFIATHYTLVSNGAASAGSPSGHSWDLYVKK